MNAFKRKTIKALTVCAVMLGSASYAQTSSIKLMVGFPAGGGTDVIARVLANKPSRCFAPPWVAIIARGPAAKFPPRHRKVRRPAGQCCFYHTITTIPFCPLLPRHLALNPTPALFRLRASPRLPTVSRCRVAWWINRSSNLSSPRVNSGKVRHPLVSLRPILFQSFLSKY